MDPPLQLEADEKLEETEEEKSGKQCRGVSGGTGEEALTCPLCAQGRRQRPSQLGTAAAHLGHSSQTP